MKFSHLHKKLKEHKESLDALIKEHKRLVSTLLHPSSSKLHKEASIQGRELKEYEREK